MQSGSISCQILPKIIMWLQFLELPNTKLYEDPHSPSWIVTFGHTADTLKLIDTMLKLLFPKAPKRMTTSAG
jgi:hypothetical protein